MESTDAHISDFVQLHQYQLEALNVPSKFYGVLWQKLENSIFDAANVFGIEEYENGKRNCVVVAEGGVHANQDIYLVDHAFSFPDSEVCTSEYSRRPFQEHLSNFRFPIYDSLLHHYHKKLSIALQEWWLFQQ
jgi:hypothetical protein